MNIFYMPIIKSISINKFHGLVNSYLVVISSILCFLTPIFSLNKLSISFQAQVIIQSIMIGIVIGIIISVVYNNVLGLDKITEVLYNIFITTDKYLYVYENIAPEDINQVWEKKVAVGVYLFTEIQEIGCQNNHKIYKTYDGKFTLDSTISNTQGHLLVEEIELGASK